MRKLVLPVLLVLLSCDDSNISTIPRRGSITESVYASGTVKAEGQYTVYSPVGGTLQTINVTAGQPVVEGQGLFGLESEKARLSVENSLLAYRLSSEGGLYIQDKVREMEINVQSAAERSRSDCSLYERYKKAQRYGGVTDADLDRAASACENSKLTLESSRRQLSQLKEQLKNEQARNNISLQINRQSRKDYDIKSAMPGRVYDVLIHEGTLVTPQTPLAVIGAKDAFLIELQVDENDMAKIALGQRVLITMDSYKDHVFEATVSKIYPIMDEHSRTFKIEALFKDSPARLYPNLSAEANIIISARKNTLIIPREYLVENDYVLVRRNEKRKIRKGLSDYRYVEITDGLDAGETIYRPER